MASTRPQIKMKVPVATLLANARKYRDEMVADNDAATLAWRKEMTAFKKQVVEGLRATLVTLSAKEGDVGDLEWEQEYLSGRYQNTKVVVRVGECPRKPETFSREEIDSDIAILTATCEETLTLTVEDRFAKYLRG